MSPCPRRSDCHRNAGHGGDCSRNAAEMARNLTRRTTTSSSSSSSSGGSAVSDIAQIKAALMAASSKLGEVAGAAQHAASLSEEAQGLLMNAMEGTSQHEFEEIRGLTASVIEHAADAQKSALMAGERCEGLAARL